jgi:hypothetical protein
VNYGVYFLGYVDWKATLNTMSIEFTDVQFAHLGKCFFLFWNIFLGKIDYM